ncbi:MAG: hypothetical protein Q8881_03400 [Sweet potato little leaf phytoplasma]|nr:hypothetical protein [Sweet potato little leaf phytoplasma]
MFLTKRPNFRRISHSWTFSPKRSNFRRISHSGRFRRNGRMNPDEFMSNFVLGNVSDETAEFLPNFTLGDVSPEMAKCPPNFALADIFDETAEFLPNFTLADVPPKRPNKSRRISAEFHTRGRFQRNGIQQLVPNYICAIKVI